jgi:hypothetical protein
VVFISIEELRLKIEDQRIRSDLIDSLEQEPEENENIIDRIPQIFNFQSSIPARPVRVRHKYCPLNRTPT